MTSLAEDTKVTAEAAHSNQPEIINSKPPPKLENIERKQTSLTNGATKAPPNVAPQSGSTSVMEQLMLQMQMQNEKFMLEVQQQELQFAQEMALLQQQVQIDLQQQQPRNINSATTTVVADTVLSTSVNPVDIGTEVAWALEKDKTMSVLAPPPWQDVTQDCEECCHSIEESIKVCPNHKVTKSTINQELAGAKPEENNMVSQKVSKIIDVTTRELPTTRERRSTTATPMTWSNMLGELRKYKEIHGHCSVPARFSSKKRLAKWVSKQRKEYWEMKEGRSSIMTAERVDILNNLGFKWKLHEDNWHDMLDDLKEFKERHGDCIVPQKYSPNPQLGRWVYTQRRAYTRNSLTKERITLLNKLGFVWKLRKSRTLIK